MNEHIIPAHNIVLIDGTYYLYKFYFALPFLNNKNKEPTGVIFGFINMIYKIFLFYSPKYLIIIFDSKEKSFRNQIFEKYKSNRKIMPIKLQKQKNIVIEIIKKLGIPVILIPKFEADDVIGTLSLKFSKKKYYILISSNDKDFTQLVSPKIKIINSIKKNIIGPLEVKKKYGVFPEQITDYLGLVGDPSDNIPGVQGIGKKTAIILLNTFGSLNKIYKNINYISKLKIPRAKLIENKITENKNNAFLSKKLATINKQVPIKEKKKNLKLKKPHKKKIIHLLKYFELKNWQKIINIISKHRSTIIKKDNHE